jgi:ABC-type polysaccharide transport system permease subunit
MVNNTVRQIYRPGRVADAGCRCKKVTTAVIRMQTSASLPAVVAVRYGEVGVFAKTPFGVLYNHITSATPPPPHQISTYVYLFSLCLAEFSVLIALDFFDVPSGVSFVSIFNCFSLLFVSLI